MNKDKPENLFNVTKNQEFKLFTSHHFKNLISPKPMEESVEPNSAKKFEAINSDNCLHFALVSYFVKKRFPRKSSDSGHGNLNLILQVE